MSYESGIRVASPDETYVRGSALQYANDLATRLDELEKATEETNRRKMILQGNMAKALIYLSVIKSTQYIATDIQRVLSGKAKPEELINIALGTMLILRRFDQLRTLNWNILQGLGVVSSAKAFGLKFSRGTRWGRGRG